MRSTLSKTQTCHHWGLYLDGSSFRPPPCGRFLLGLPSVGSLWGCRAPPCVLLRFFPLFPPPLLVRVALAFATESKLNYLRVVWLKIWLRSGLA